MGPPADQRGRVLVIVPAKDEAATIGTVLDELARVGYDVLVVDDGSTDDTAAVARAKGAVVTPLPFNLGVGGALRCGFRYAVDRGYAIAVQCDADGQHRPDQINVLLHALQEHGAHLVIGSRFGDHADYRVTGSRRLVMKLLSGLVRAKTGLRLTDTTSGFRGIARPLLAEFAASYPTQYLGDTFEAAMVAARAGYRVVEVPVQMHLRASGTSSAGTWAAGTHALRAVLDTVFGLGFRIRPLSEHQGSTTGAAPAGSAPDEHTDTTGAAAPSAVEPGAVARSAGAGRAS